MTEQIDNQFQIKNSCRLRDKGKSGVDLDTIVKFLNAQRAVIDYAGLN